MTPFFSIIIPTYNRATFLPATINSVLSQSFKNWECIVVDDGSTDNTEEVIQNFGDYRIKYYYKKHEERSITRNFGIDLANGSYICFLDSDDQYYDDHLRILYFNVREKGYPKGIFNTGMHENRGGELIERPIYEAKYYRHPVNFIWENFLLINSICVHRDILKLHKFPEKFNVWEDTHLWLRIAACYPFHQITEVTSQWNIHQEGSVSRAFNKIDAKHVWNYLKCISNLFKNHGDLLLPYLNKRDMRNYQFKKLKMFLELSFNRGDYKTFTKLYFIGLKFVGKKKLSLFVSKKLFRKIKSKI